MPKLTVMQIIRFPVRIISGLAGRSARSKQNPIVPPQAVAGTALIAVIAIMGFLASLTFAAVTMVYEQAQLWGNDISGEITIQIRPTEGVDLAFEVTRAVQLANNFPGIKTVEPMSAEDGAGLLSPWLGAGLDLDELPVPRLIIVEIEGPGEIDVKELTSLLEREISGVSVDDHGIWINQLKRIVNITIATGIGIFLLVLSATCLCVVFATRGAMAGNQTVISVLHFVGALNKYIAFEFQRHFLVVGLKGGITGCFFAIVFFVVGGRLLGLLEGPSGGSPFQTLFGGFSLTPLVFAGFFLVLVIVSGLTALTTRITVERYLAEIE